MIHVADIVHAHHHPLLRQLRLRAQSPPCGGQTAGTNRRRDRADPLVGRRIRDRRERRIEIFQTGARPVSGRCGDRRDRAM